RRAGAGADRTRDHQRHLRRNRRAHHLAAGDAGEGARRSRGKEGREHRRRVKPGAGGHHKPAIPAGRKGMETSLYSAMRLGIVHFKAYPGIETGTGPIVETLEKIYADEFWTAVEVGWMKHYRVRNTARALLDQSHLSVAYATQPKALTNKLNLNHPDRAERQKAVDAIRDCVDEARQLGAEVVRLIAGKDPGDAVREEAKKRLVDSLCQILDYAGEEKDGLAFTLKLFDRSIDKKNLIGPAPDALDIAKAVRPDFPNFGLLVDLSHFPLLDERPEESIPLLAEHLE